MKTVVVGPRPAELEELIRRRHELGQDLFDEVWEGSYHMAPAPHSRHSRVSAEVTRVMLPLAQAVGLFGLDPFNLGEPEDYRVPDHGWVYEVPDSTYLPTAAIVVEVLSPDDETFDKLPFYAGHGVQEVFVVDPMERRVRIFCLVDGRYEEPGGSRLLGVNTAQLEDQIRWP
jgi:Uma2 family endonuclease